FEPSLTATLTREGTSVETWSRAPKGAWLARVSVGPLRMETALQEGCRHKAAEMSNARIGQGRIEGTERRSTGRLINGSVLINIDQAFLLFSGMMFVVVCYRPVSGMLAAFIQ